MIFLFDDGKKHDIMIMIITCELFYQCVYFSLTTQHFEFMYVNQIKLLMWCCVMCAIVGHTYGDFVCDTLAG
jgi:hypothetical protein